MICMKNETKENLDKIFRQTGSVNKFYLVAKELDFKIEVIDEYLEERFLA